MACLARPSWPFVAMITAVANRAITPLKIRNLAVFDAWQDDQLDRQHHMADTDSDLRREDG